VLGIPIPLLTCWQCGRGTNEDRPTSILQAEEGFQMVELEKPAFDVAAFLAQVGLGRRIVQLAPKQPFFSQGDSADSVFYLQKGSAKVTVVSHAGKEATIRLISAGDFVGEESLAAVHGLRLATATAIAACTALKIGREEMIRVMHEEHDFSDLFLRFLLSRSMRIQADLVDQLFNSSEKRLARILLLMAEFGKPGEPGTADSQDFAGDPGGDDRDNTVPRQLLHEPLSQARLYRIQRPHSCAQIAAQYCPTRSIARAQSSDTCDGRRSITDSRW